MADSNDNATSITAAPATVDSSAWTLLAVAPHRKTRDNCREFESGPILASYNELNASENGRVITHNLGELLPALAKMQALLSQRGANKNERKRFNSLNLPSWTEYFERFKQQAHLEASLRAVQRGLKATAGASTKQHCVLEAAIKHSEVGAHAHIVTPALESSSIILKPIRGQADGQPTRGVDWSISPGRSSRSAGSDAPWGGERDSP